MRRWESVKKNLTQTMTFAPAAAIGVVSPRALGVKYGALSPMQELPRPLARLLVVVLACWAVRAFSGWKNNREG
jgi:hypothetical protein